MCGRFTLTVDPDVVQMQFDLEPFTMEAGPRYNIAPTQPVLALTNEGSRRPQMLRWGLIPPWVKDAAIGSRLINARAETLTEKPAFRGAVRRRRCVIFADGFYEWRKEHSGARTPLYIHLHDGRPFAIAGLWEAWRPAEGEDWLRTCTLITTAANAFIASIHDRMPVMLERGDMEAWLTPGEADLAALLPVLRPYAGGDLAAYPVSRAVNNPRFDSPDLIRPAASEAEQPNLL